MYFHTKNIYVEYINHDAFYLSIFLLKCNCKLRQNWRPLQWVSGSRGLIRRSDAPTMHHAAPGNNGVLSEQSRNRYIKACRAGTFRTTASTRPRYWRRLPGPRNSRDTSRGGCSAPTSHRLGVATAAATPGAEPQSLAAAYFLMLNSAAFNI